MRSAAIIKDITIGPCRMILGDSMAVLPLLDEKADMGCMDPPYPLTSGGNAVEVMGGLFSHAEYDNGGELMDMVRWDQMGGPIYRALKPSADCYVMSNDKNLFAAHGGFTGAGFELHNILSWNKVRATRNRWYMKHNEFTLYFWKGTARVINNCGSMQTFTLNAPRESGHPTEKPVALMAHYIENSSDIGDLVLDPFMGSGTTMIACVETGRRGVGIEKDPEYYEIACARVQAALDRQISDTRQEVRA